MKASAFASLFVALLFPGKAVHGEVFSCDAHTSRAGTTKTILDHTTISDRDTSVTLTNTAASGELCTLYTLAYSEGGLQFYYIPAGRSYDGRNWERAAGKFSGLEFTCQNDDSQVRPGETCTVTLEDTDLRSYYLTSYKYELTPRQYSARFFERSTFGANTAMLDEMSTAEEWGACTTESECVDAQTAWIADQQNPSVVPTVSHREWFRERLNPRSVEVYKYGLSGPNACSSGSVWRTFAFTKKDWYMSTGDELDGKMRSIWPMDFWHNVTLEERDVGGNVKYVWTYAGHVRTMMVAQPRYYDGSNPGDLIPLGTYDVCGVSDLPGSYYVDQQASFFDGDADRTHAFVKRHAKFKIRLGDDGPCQHVYGGNPDVVVYENYLDHDSSGEETYVLDLSGHAAEFQDKAVNNIGHIDPDSVTRLTADAAEDGTNNAVCATVPDPNKADFRSTGIWHSPYYVVSVQQPSSRPAPICVQSLLLPEPENVALQNCLVLYLTLHSLSAPTFTGGRAPRLEPLIQVDSRPARLREGLRRRIPPPRSPLPPSREYLDNSDHGRRGTSDA